MFLYMWTQDVFSWRPGRVDWFWWFTGSSLKPELCSGGLGNVQVNETRPGSSCCRSSRATLHLWLREGGERFASFPLCALCVCCFLTLTCLYMFTCGHLVKQPCFLWAPDHRAWALVCLTETSQTAILAHVAAVWSSAAMCRSISLLDSQFDLVIIVLGWTFIYLAETFDPKQHYVAQGRAVKKRKRAET